MNQHQHQQPYAGQPTRILSLAAQGGSSIPAKVTRRLNGSDEEPDLGLASHTAHTAPWLMFLLGGLGVFIGVVTNLTQVWTSFSAFQLMLDTGSVFTHLKLAEQAKVMPVHTAIAAVIALCVQTGVLFVAFRVDVAWKRRRVEGHQSLRATAVEIAHQPTLLLLYGAVCFVANCIGDYGFVSTFTDSLLILFFWGLSLTAGATLILMEAAQYLWSGYRAYKAYHAQMVSIHQHHQP